MKIIDGKKIASEIREKLKSVIEKEKLAPQLAIIMVGDNTASEVYVKNKIKACQEIGIIPIFKHFEVDTPEKEIIEYIISLNQNININGIIVQSPLPSKFNEEYITSFIASNKDVDGFGIENLGYLASNNSKFIAATPLGILKLLEKEKIAVSGKNVVIIGRSKIVGRPLALALLNKDATVTIAHSKTKNLKEICKRADILVVAIGKPNYITAEYIKDNAVVIDVGINRVDGKICGDVDFILVKDKVSYITPVPGGVGPMTVAMLLSNVVKSSQIKKDNGDK